MPRTMLLLAALSLLLAACGAREGAAPAVPGGSAEAGAPTTAPTEVTPTDAPAATPTDAPAATPTDAPAATPTDAPPAATPTDAPTAADTSATRDALRTALPAASPEAEPVPTRGPAVTGEAPTDLIEAMAADLMGRTGASRDQISVVSDEAITWSDGSLGCPRPGVSYIQVLIDGYRVVLGYAGAEYSYHADSNGEFLLCEKPDQP